MATVAPRANAELLGLEIGLYWLLILMRIGVNVINEVLAIHVKLVIRVVTRGLKNLVLHWCMVLGMTVNWVGLNLLLMVGILGIVLEASILMLMVFLMMLLSGLLVAIVPVVGFLMPLMQTLRMVNIMA